MVVRKDGHVGIGTNIPDEILHVAGKIKVEDMVIGSTNDSLVTWNPADSTLRVIHVDGIRPSYTIGDFAQGGIVIWVDETGQHGLVCAKEDLSTGIRWYAGDYTNTMAKGDGPLSGEMNTGIIISNQGYGDGSTYAARVCAEYKVTEGSKTFGDWYLPSIEELNLMYQNKATINATATANGGSVFTNYIYWSSTEHSTYASWGQNFDIGTQNAELDKLNANPVRAIRAF